MSITLLAYTIVGTFFSFILIILFSLMDGLDVPAIIQRAWAIPLGGMLVGSCLALVGFRICLVYFAMLVHREYNHIYHI